MCVTKTHINYKVPVVQLFINFVVKQCTKKVLLVNFVSYSKKCIYAAVLWPQNITSQTRKFTPIVQSNDGQKYIPQIFLHLYSVFHVIHHFIYSQGILRYDTYVNAMLQYLFFHIVRFESTYEIVKLAHFYVTRVSKNKRKHLCDTTFI